MLQANAMNGFLIISEAAKRLDVTRQRVHIYIKQGRLDVTEIVGRKVVTTVQVDRLRDELKAARAKFGMGGRKKRKKAA